ncbi:hypothetical protein COO60DRAFT_1551248, partial [Scenedesmus sp. NREL 46B-D3]
AVITDAANFVASGLCGMVLLVCRALVQQLAGHVFPLWDSWHVDEQGYSVPGFNAPAIASTPSPPWWCMPWCMAAGLAI